MIIPAYNAAAYLEEAVESAVRQAYAPVEIVVVDDGSTDATPEILHSYRTAGKIIHIRQDNKGLAAARNAGIRASSGEYVAFLDADDLFLPEKIALQAAYLDAHPACDVSYCGLWHFYEDDPDRLLQLDYEYPSGDAVFPALLRKNFVNPLSVVMRRTAFERFGMFDETFRRSEDWELWVRLAHQGARFDYLPERLAKYRMRRGSMSYGSESEVERKRTALSIFTRLSARMDSKERGRYGMFFVVLRHKARFWHARCAELFPFLHAIRFYLQKRRLLA